MATKKELKEQSREVRKHLKKCFTKQSITIITEFMESVPVLSGNVEVKEVLDAILEGCNKANPKIKKI